MNILVLAAHPDDEVLGMGATIKKLSKKGNKIHLCVVTEGASGQYKDPKMIKVRRDSCLKAGKILGISNFDFFDFPDAKLDAVPQLEINTKIEKILKKYNSDVVYTTPYDLSKDHQKVFESTLVACRPLKSSVKQILCYEIPGYSFTSFEPNTYENVTKEFPLKIKAFQVYKSEVEEFPSPRSLEFIENLAKVRGVESGFKKAEAFRLIRNNSV